MQRLTEHRQGLGQLALRNLGWGAGGAALGTLATVPLNLAMQRTRLGEVGEALLRLGFLGGVMAGQGFGHYHGSKEFGHKLSRDLPTYKGLSKHSARFTPEELKDYMKSKPLGPVSSGLIGGVAGLPVGAALGQAVLKTTGKNIRDGLTGVGGLLGLGGGALVGHIRSKAHRERIQELEDKASR